MKKPVALLLAMILALTMLAGCSGDGKNSPSSAVQSSSGTQSSESGTAEKPLEEAKLVVDVVGDGGYPRVPEVTEALNKVLKEKINTTIEFQYITKDAYNLSLTSMENVDVLYTADYLGYYDNARKGAFAELTKDVLEKYAPTYMSWNSKLLPSATVDGKIYALPHADIPLNCVTLALRKDLMDKYGIKEVKTLEDFGLYLSKIKENEKGMTPFALNKGLSSWYTGALGFQYAALMAPGGPNCTSPIALKKTDDPYKLYRTWEVPELKEFFRVMQDFRKKGYWSQDALANPVDMNEAFIAGKSGVARASVGYAANSLYVSVKESHPDWGVYLFELNPTGIIDTYSPMGGAMSIPRSSKNYERAIMLMELIYTDEEVGRLINYGILGEDYEVNDKGEFKMLNWERYDEGGYGMWGLMDPRLKFKPWDMMDGLDKIVSDIDSRTKPNPYVGFGLNTSDITDIASNLQAVQAEFGTPLFMGLVDDVDKAYETMNKKLLDAGLVEYEKAVRDQLTKYIDDMDIPEKLAQ